MSLILVKGACLTRPQIGAIREICPAVPDGPGSHPSTGQAGLSGKLLASCHTFPDSHFIVRMVKSRRCPLASWLLRLTPSR